MTCICVIFARGGSKGLPGKNIKPLNGTPLIGYSITTAKQCESIDAVYVSTDDEAIAHVATGFGAKIIPRPKELASDNSPEWLSWQHAIDFLKAQNVEVETFVTLPATSPLRSVEDVERCIATLEADTDIVVTVTEANRSPYFNMLKMDDKGFCQKVIDTGSFARRQDVPEVFDMTTVAYVARADYILNNESIFSGKVKSVEIPRIRAVDIDTALDFKFAEFLVENMDESDKC